MATQIFVVTAPEVVETGRRSFKFMFDAIPHDKMPRELMELSNIWGYLMLRDKGDDEIDPFKFVRGEEGAIGPDGVKKWDVNLFDSDGFVLAGHFEECEPESETWKKFLQESMRDCVLLMRRDIFDRFEEACKIHGVKVTVHHSDKTLKTS